MRYRLTIFAVAMLAMLGLCPAIAQILNLNPTPIGVYTWNTTTNQFEVAPNLSTAEPFALTPQAFAFYGFNAALGQWTPCINGSNCLGGGGGGGIPYPPAGIPVSLGNAWSTSYQPQGADSKLLTSSSLSGTGSVICTDVTGGATTSGCPTFPATLTLEHNGTALVDQTLLNFNDASPAPPAGNEAVTFQTDSGGDLSAYVPAPPNFANTLGFVPAPPVSGQYVFLTPTAHTVVAGGNGPGCLPLLPAGPTGFAIGTSTSGYMGNTCTGNGFTANHWGVDWSGFSLPGGIASGSVTAVYDVSLANFNPNFSGSSSPNITCTSTHDIGVDVTPAFPGPLVQTNAIMPTTVGTDISTLTCQASVNYSTNFPAAYTYLNVPSIGLFVYYTGTPVAQPTVEPVLPPLFAGAQGLGLDPYANLFTLTTTGSTGAATYVNNVLNVPTPPVYLSGMTATQVPIAATVGTVTSSKPLAGTGSGITTGPTTSTNTDCVQFAGIGGQIADSGSPCGSGSGVPSVNGIATAVTIAAGSGISVGTAAGTITVTNTSAGSATQDILSDQKPTGTPWFNKGEYLTSSSGTPITLVNRSGAGYVDTIFISDTQSYGTSSTLWTINISVNGEATPSISGVIGYLFGSMYKNTGSGAATHVESSLWGYNSYGQYLKVPIPYTNGVVISVTPNSSITYWYTINGQTSVPTTNWTDTKKLRAIPLVRGTPTSNATAAYAQENLVNYAGTAGRYVGLWTMSDDFPGSLSPDFANLEGNYRIFTDTFNWVWAASTSTTSSTTIMDPNGNLQTSGGGTTGGTIPSSWGLYTGATTTDGSVTWVATVGEPANVYFVSQPYSIAGMSVYDSNGNVETVTTTGTTGGSAPSWPSTGSCPGTVTIDNSAHWTCSLGSTVVHAAYESSGTEDYPGLASYFSGTNYGVAGDGEIGITQKNSSTVGWWRWHLRNPIRFNNAIAIYRENGDSSEKTFTGSASTWQTAWIYTSETN